MECVKNIIGCVLLGFILLLASVLQAIGTFFGSEWIKDSCISINPKPSCCNLTVLDHSRCGNPYSLEACFIEAFCSKDEGVASCWAVLGGLAYLLYPIAGLLSFVGCMVIVGKYSGHTPGSSFYYCLGCGLFVLFLTGIAICIFCYNKKHKRSREPTTNAVQTYGQTTVTAEAITIEQRGFVHDPKTGGFAEFLISINITHIVIHHKFGD